MNEQYPLSNFNFNELVNMVRTIAKTKNQSSNMVWREGTELKSIDHLEANVDSILLELVNRVKRKWSLDRIQYNFATSTLLLPNQIMNLFNITPSELNRRLQQNPPTIGATEKENHELIWIIIGDKKYIMNENGNIEMEQLPKN